MNRSGNSAWNFARPVPVGMPGRDPDDPPVGPGELDRARPRRPRCSSGVFDAAACGRPRRSAARGVVGHRLGRHRPAAGRRPVAAATVEAVRSPAACDRRHRRQGGAVEPDLVGLGRAVAAALLGPDVDDRRARAASSARRKRLRAALQVVAGHDADVGDAEVLEQLARAGRSRRPTGGAGGSARGRVRPDDRDALDDPVVGALALLPRAATA